MASWRSPLESTEEISRNQGSELSNATIVPQGDVVAEMTRGEDNADSDTRKCSGNCHAHRH